jgi:hypothetical protein
MAEKPMRELERGAVADLSRHTRSRIPSVFGRLVFLTALRSPMTGRYEHYGLALVFGAEEADQALRTSHEKAFREWLSFNLENQKADLALYLSELPIDRKSLMVTWFRLTPYRNLVPASARSAERALFLGDLETLLALMRNEYGLGELDPDA